MLRCGLLGQMLGHSFSPRIHRELGNYQYQLFEREPEQLADFLHGGGFDALNITIPYKKAVMPLLDEIGQQAQDIGSVNTVIRRGDGSLWGGNTDIDGFLYLLRRSGISACGRKCLVFGSGGAGVTVSYALRQAGAAEVRIISRSGEDNYRQLHRHYDAELLVNATPLGMFPDNSSCPVDLRPFTHCCGVLDVIYNPTRTALLRQAASLGIPGGSGLPMLVAQAKRAAELFTGTTLPDSETERIIALLERETENIVLIGSDRTRLQSVAAALAALSGRDLYRLTPQQEESSAARLGKLSGAVIAAAAADVDPQRDYPLLEQNGRLILLRDGDKQDAQQTAQRIWEEWPCVY